jgi:hypothetical protein
MREKELEEALEVAIEELEKVGSDVVEHLRNVLKRVV